MRIGIIGTGNMGGMLAKAFATCSNVDVTVYNRTREKAEKLTAQFPKIRIAKNARDAAYTSDVIFICTKSSDGEAVLSDIGAVLNSRQTLVTTISRTNLEDWEGKTAAQVAKAIPSIVQTERSGVMLLTVSDRFDSKAQDQLMEVLQTICTPFCVDDAQLRICSDITSCGPAFIAYLCSLWAETAHLQSNLSHAETEYLLCQTLMGTANLLRTGMTLTDIVGKVAVPGGVTEIGLAVLQDSAPGMFKRLHDATQQYAEGTLHRS